MPPEAVAAAVAVGLEPVDMVETSRTGRRASLAVWTGSGYAVVVAADDSGRRANRLEVQGRRWAHEVGIHSPEIVAADAGGAWIISRWARAVDGSSADYVSSALDAADMLMAAEPAPGGEEGTTWRAGPRGRLARMSRMAAGRVNLARWVAARRAADELPATAMAHGDFYFRNVIHTGTGRVDVVDWEFCGPAPAFTDHLRFWSTLKSESDADLAMGLILAGRTEAQLRDIAVLARWLAYRLLGENISARRQLRNAADLEHARVAVRRAEHLYRELAGEG